MASDRRNLGWHGIRRCCYVLLFCLIVALGVLWTMYWRSDTASRAAQVERPERDKGSGSAAREEADEDGPGSEEADKGTADSRNPEDPTHQASGAERKKRVDKLLHTLLQQAPDQASMGEKEKLFYRLLHTEDKEEKQRLIRQAVQEAASEGIGVAS